MVTNFRRTNLFIKIIYLCLILVILLIFTQLLFPKAKPNKYPYDEPIDVVYTWVNGSDKKFIEDLQKCVQVNSSISNDYSIQRYDDKYELKFSLRSLEKYAPWVHHIYIVTNGQIPYWLNLDYEKVTLISHREIFKDILHLPTFSSPAIESHLHRIPGLTNRFIYFNDDIFLGAPVFIDDFISPSRGYLIYLAWPLPMCALDCPWLYVGDGQCDFSCYNPNCQMDGDDCSYEKKVQTFWNQELLYSKDGGSLLNLQHYQETQNVTKPKNFNRWWRKTNSNNIPKQLNNSKIALAIHSTIMNVQNVIYLHNNSGNITNIVQEHNSNVILHNKLNRHKRYHLRNTGSIYHSDNLLSNNKNNELNVDIFGASLQHTNRIFNLRYGFKSRNVPAHSPIMIDKNIMEDLQKTFTKEFLKTSMNKIRSEDDMQFGFSYYYYLISTKVNISMEGIFDRFDTDGSGTWSDREIRTILTKIYDLPLSYTTVEHFEDILMNCSKYKNYPVVPTPEFERYVDSKLPTVSKNLVIKCPVLSDIFKEHFGSKHKYKYEIINNAQSTHVIFKMLNSNISDVVGHLDEIRRRRRKFICLNDNMDESKISENELIRSVLYDFYLSLFPKPSKFELHTDFRNRFLYLDELNQWKSYHFKLKICTYICIFILCYLAYCNLFKRRCLYRVINKLFC